MITAIVKRLLPVYRKLLHKSGIFFVAVSLVCSSCAQPQQSPPPPPPVFVEPPQSLAEMLFLKGDFANALLEYEQIYETALTEEDRNPALYGLACTQLMLAHSDSQFAEAISNLENWDAEKSNKHFTENSHLLVTALKFQSERIQKRNQAQAALAKQKNSVIANQSSMITQMLTTVNNLQKQLEELEAIDETLQEKRNPL
jgi:hypothetical protein